VRALLQLSSLVDGETQIAPDRGFDLRAAPLEDAREITNRSVGNREGRAVMTERDCNDRGVHEVSRAAPRRDRAEERKRLDVDAHQFDAARSTRCYEVVDRLAVSRCEHDAARDATRLVRSLADDVIVEHGLIHWNRERFVGAEPNGVSELLRVFDALDVKRADTDAIRADPDPDAFPRQVMLREERVECLAERSHIAHLTADDDARREG
jgi:hypothetical protein